MLSWKSACGKSNMVISLSIIPNLFCRNYTVNNHWPRTGVTVTQVKGMYSKMRSSEMNNKQPATPQQSNGQKTES